MIIVKNNKITGSNFTDLLSKTRTISVDRIKKLGIEKMGGVEFENFTFEMMKKASSGTKFHDDIKQTGKQTFPDIIANKFYGTEVKVTVDNKWISTGNSVLETTRVSGIEKIYMFFGKFGGDFNIKYRLYQDCLSDIGVTHYPRYKINMDLPEGESIFSKLGIEYDKLRKLKNPVNKVKDYYRSHLSPGEELWWIDTSPDDVIKLPTIKLFHLLSKKEQEQFKIETMAFFPEIFGNNNRTKYERTAAYLAAQYQAVTSSMRDKFTAGGQVTVGVNNKKIIIPKIIFHAHENAKLIKKIINGTESEVLLRYWNIEKITGSKIKTWYNLLDGYSKLKKSGVKASDIFRAGL